MMILVLIISVFIVGLILSNFDRLKDFQAFNSWLILFTCLLLLFPLLSGILLIDNFIMIIKQIPFRTLKAIIISSLFGGLSFFLLFNAIRKMHEVTAITVFSASVALAFGILFQPGIIFWLVVFVPLVFVVFSVRYFSAGNKIGLNDFLLPIVGGLVSMGYVRAFQVEPHTIFDLAQSFGTQSWQIDLLQMNLIALASGIFVFPIFLSQMGQKNAWIYYDTPHFWRNIFLLILFSIVIFTSVFLCIYFCST